MRSWVVLAVVVCLACAAWCLPSASALTLQPAGALEATEGQDGMGWATIVDDLKAAFDQEGDEQDQSMLEVDASSAPKAAAPAPKKTAPNKAAPKKHAAPKKATSSKAHKATAKKASSKSKAKAAPKHAAAAPQHAAAPKKASRISAMSPAQFRRMLNAHAPKKRTGGRGLKPKPRKAKKNPAAPKAPATHKARFAQVEAEAEAEAETETDVDVEAELDAEAETDAEAAAELDAEAEADAEVDADADSEAEAETEAEAEGENPHGAGHVATASGASAGAAGATAEASGASAGASGASAGASGASAGASGASAGASGASAGHSKIVAPTSKGPAMAAGTGDSLGTIAAKFGSAGSALKKMFDRPGQLSLQNERISSQQQCGSCWAMAAIGSLEIMLKQTHKYHEPLSVQQAIDCVRSTEAGAGGCEGGTPMDVLDYFKTHPVATEREYPTTGVAGECQEYEPKGGKVYAAGFQLVAPACMAGSCSGQWQNEIRVLQELQKKGAVALIAYVDASQWQNYSKGLFPVSKCSSSAEAGNHVIQIVGWGTQSVSDARGGKTNVPFWKIRNSWGPSWGDNGFIELPFGVNACGLMNYVGHAAMP